MDKGEAAVRSGSPGDKVNPGQKNIQAGQAQRDIDITRLTLLFGSQQKEKTANEQEQCGRYTMELIYLD